MSTLDPRVSLWLDKSEITEVIYRVARAIDRMDEGLLRDCYWPDATDDHGLVKGTVDEFVVSVTEMLNSMQFTQHTVGNVLVEVEGDRARAESYFIAYHRLPTPDAGDGDMFAAGRYLDRFERRNGSWKISHRLAAYDWSLAQPASDDGWKTKPVVDLLLRGQRGTGDASYAHFAELNQAEAAE